MTIKIQNGLKPIFLFKPNIDCSQSYIPFGIFYLYKAAASFITSSRTALSIASKLK